MNCAVHTQTQAAAFCRTCGKALCEDCKRDVMGAIYCEPCIAARLQGTPPPVAQVVPAAPGAPSPGLAGFLGLIPGVGAWYNGQFIKGFVHVLIFALLIVAANSVHNDGLEVLFGLLIPAFIVYMAFDAVTTARARIMGHPLPDPLGLERLFGFHDNPPPVATPAAASYVAAPGAPGSPANAVAPSDQPLVPQNNPPIGAIVLIAIGALFLLDNLTGMVNFHRLWPLILIGIGLWIAYKRTAARGGAQ